VLTHGFTMAEDGRKMSKSLNNQVFPQDIIKPVWRRYPARLGGDHVDTPKTSASARRSSRPWSTATASCATRCAGRSARWPITTASATSCHAYEMPELERYMLHRLTTLDATVREAYDNFDFQKVFQTLFTFATVDLSAFYFDVRKDALYCDAPSSMRRRPA
jgi:isoleucyl-tRNA synthetase